MHWRFLASARSPPRSGRLSAIVAKTMPFAIARTPVENPAGVCGSQSGPVTPLEHDRLQYRALVAAISLMRRAFGRFVTLMMAWMAGTCRVERRSAPNAGSNNRSRRQQACGCGRPSRTRCADTNERPAQGPLLPFGNAWRRDFTLPQIEPIEVHDLGPGGDEVLHEFVSRVVLCIDFGHRAQLRVRSEDQITASSQTI